MNLVGKLEIFRDALSSFAAQIVRAGTVKDPEFKVTADMRDGFWRVMQSRKLLVPRDVFDDAHEAIDRVVGAEIALQGFGVLGAQRRAVHNDAVIGESLALLRGATTTSVLFERVAARNAAAQKKLAKR